LAKYLVGKGAKISARNSKALLKAVMLEDIEMVEYLLQMGADPSNQDNKACWFYTPSLVDTFYTVSGIYI